MAKLDLHGIRHSEVTKFVDQFIYANLNKLPIEVVTGYSDKMKQLVIESVEDHGLEYQIGDSLGINQGFIKIF